MDVLQNIRRKNKKIGLCKFKRIYEGGYRIMENRCVCCGRISPEGEQVCYFCEARQEYDESKRFPPDETDHLLAINKEANNGKNINVRNSG